MREQSARLREQHQRELKRHLRNEQELAKLRARKRERERADQGAAPVTGNRRRLAMTFCSFGRAGLAYIKPTCEVGRFDYRSQSSVRTIRASVTVVAMNVEEGWCRAMLRLAQSAASIPQE